jgi:peptidase E
MRSIKPIFLFADSQILFWRSQEELFIERLKRTIESDENRPEGEITAAYLGASNHNKPEYFDIFVAAMNQIGITKCRHIKSKPTADDYSFLRTADLVLLSGGSTATGWNVFTRTGLQEKITECYHNGAVLVGISAGAIQLGMRGWKSSQRIPKDLFETFQIVPAVIDVHDDAEWEYLHKLVKHLGTTNRGFGIPHGGGAVYHPDWSFEAIRHHLVEISFLDDEIKQSLIFPKQEGMPDEVPDEDDHRGKVIHPDEVMTSGIINVDPEIIER